MVQNRRQNAFRRCSIFVSQFVNPIQCSSGVAEKMKITLVTCRLTSLVILQIYRQNPAYSLISYCQIFHMTPLTLAGHSSRILGLSTNEPILVIQQPLHSFVRKESKQAHLLNGEKQTAMFFSENQSQTYPTFVSVSLCRLAVKQKNPIEFSTYKQTLLDSNYIFYAYDVIIQQPAELKLADSNREIF